MNRRSSWSRAAWWGAAAIALSPVAARATPQPSTLPVAPGDPAAIIVHGAGDGRADDTGAVQQAIDAAHRGPDGNGIVFLPAGRYRLSRSIMVPPGVRLFGTGATRPVLMLGDATPGFQTGVATLIVFTGGDQYRVGHVPVPIPTLVPPNDTVRDANSSTFYSAMSNIDIDLGQGNPAAAGVRLRVAQHGYLSHMDMRIGSGFAGIYQAGNEIEDVHFHGGRYGIVTEKTSPAWPFTVIDSSFDGQRSAAIREHEADLTLVDVAIRDTPIGIDIDQGYSDSLWGSDVRFERVSQAAVVVSEADSALTQIGFENAVATDTPVFVRFRDTAKTVAAPARTYRIAAFDHGLMVPGLGQMGHIATTVTATALAALPPPPPPALPALPPAARWTNVRTLGVHGDGRTDDTAALQRAIDTHDHLYFPAGVYPVTATLHLRPATALIGLHPAMTAIAIPDGSAAFSGVGGVVPLVESARGGNAIVSGIGLATGRGNPRANALMWKAGAGSLVDDVKIGGGAGTPNAASIVQDGHSGDPVADRRIDTQYPSIWVTDGGGGTFAAVWTPNTIAQAGFYVSNTDTPGHVYELSNEHHVRNEIVLDHVAHWRFLAPQTEQEVPEGMDAVSLEVRDSHDILFANYHAYRVTRTFHPAATAVKLFRSSDIRFRNVHTNAESGFATCQEDGCGTYARASKFAFEDAIRDVTHGLAMRERAFAVLDIPADPAPVTPATIGAPVTRLADGFFSISGGAVDAHGALYFVEHRFQRIYRWTAADGLEVVRDNPLDPVNLAVAASGDIMVLSSLGADTSVYSFDPAAPKDGRVTMIAPTPVASHRGATTLLPVDWWVNGEFRDQYDPATDHFTTLAEMFVRDAGMPKPREYVSPDGSIVLPAFRVWEQGPPDHVGWRFSDTLDAYGFATAKQSERVFVTDASLGRTYQGIVAAGGALTDLTRFADRGGESVATDGRGRVYIADGQVFVVDGAGAPIGRIDVPERPLQLVVGGADRHTLFILTHHALYAVGI